MVASENKFFMRGSPAIFQNAPQVVADGSGRLGSDLRKNLSKWQPTRRAFLELLYIKFAKK